MELGAAGPPQPAQAAAQGGSAQPGQHRVGFECALGRWSPGGGGVELGGFLSTVKGWF